MTSEAIKPRLSGQAMRNRILRDWSLRTVLAVLFALLLGGRSQDLLAQSQTEIAAATTPEPAAPPEAPASSDQAADAQLASSPTQPISTEKPLPAGVKPSGPVMEVVRLANSGVDQSVVLAYIANSPDIFNLSSDDIIYLNDLGIPSNIVNAMIQHDQAMRGPQTAPIPVQPPAAPPGPNVATELLPPPENSSPYAPAPAPSDASSMPPVAIYPPPAPMPDNASEDGGQPPDVAPDSAFYDSLAPYGTWVNVAGYGNCWQPTAGILNVGWQPYFNCGRWVYSDCGWYWLSGYTWGWAPFHYGRWFRHGTLGWCWSPGNVWGPSWVAWRSSPGYCGWAPLPPSAWFSPSLGLTFRGQAVASTFGFGLTAQSFAFVSFNHFHDAQLTRFAVPSKQVPAVFVKTSPSTAIAFSNTRVINNGLSPSTVAAITHTSISRVSISQVASTSATKGGRTESFAANGSTLSVFRPNTPQAPGSKASFTARPATSVHGGPHALNTTPQMGTPLIVHGSTQTAQTTARTAWKDIPRGNVAYNNPDEAARYQRWQQSIQPSQQPWYLRNASSGSQTVTRTTSQNAIAGNLAELQSRNDVAENGSATTYRQWQYGSPSAYQSVHGGGGGGYSANMSANYSRQSGSQNSQSSGSFNSRASAPESQTYSAPSGGYSAPVNHAAPSYSGGGQSHSSSVSTSGGHYTGH